MEVLQMTRRSQNSPSYHCLLAVYFEQHLHARGMLAATKEIQHVIDTTNDGTLYTYKGLIRVLCEERLQNGRYRHC